MRLFLHVGLNKTGSSYLQSILATNRPFLQSARFYFPHGGKRESDMMKGRVSPGNAAELNQRLVGKDYAAASTLLAAWLVEAEQQGLENILLSNERLFAAFADRDTLFRFYEITQQVGISEVHSLMILRDPVDHALSLYKHKGKSGKLPSFGQWIGSAYETPGLLNDLIAHFDKVPINWTFRSYSSNSKAMLKLFFEDWLRIGLPPSRSFDRVNSSLSLSEVLLLSAISKCGSPLVADLYKELIKIPAADKASDGALDNLYRTMAQKRLVKYTDLFESLNALLPVAERMKFAAPGQPPDAAENIVLSKAQVDGISRALGRNRSVLGSLNQLLSGVFGGR